MAKEIVEEKPKAVMLDAHGRLVDEKGNLVQTQQYRELKVNATNLKDSKTKDLLKIKKMAQQNEFLARRRFFDSELEVGKKRERKKTGALNFVQEGSQIRKGEVLRRQQAMGEVDEKIK
mmetsp:Transcript_11570/g.8443  ORF Transcript_11570/g.8443 Transcript_11570/m.8443 type:complete len:119 (+) Transcript_11570:91-447(+)